MAKIINFNKAGKKIAQIKKRKRAHENKVKYGQDKLTRNLIKRENKTVKTYLDNLKLNQDDDNNNKS